MRLRRVTVHFGATRVVVPLKDHGMTVEELGHKAATRYERATGKPEGSIIVHRMELVDGGGILDPEDLVDDLLEVETDHILAICDEATDGEKPHANVVTIGEPSTSSGIVNSSSSSSMHRYDKLKSPVLGRVKGSVVEITSLENPPGLRVSNTSISNNAKSSNNSPHGGLSVQAQPLRSSLRTADNKDNPPRTVNRVTLSPEVEKKLSVEQERSSFTHLQRSSARKSRISDQFYDAIERLGLEERSDQAGSRPLSGTIPLTSISTRKRPPLMPCPSDPESTVVVFPDDESSSMGIEVTGITDEDTGKLASVQIIRLDDDGRVGMDGRLRVGDNIVHINGKHVSQLTILRARALLHDLTTLSAPSLTVARPISSFSEFHRSEPSTSSSTSLPTKRPILSALQQANTQQLGDTQTVTVQKLSSGFGFTVTGRETARGERLFYVGTVKIGGAAVGLLKAGDRLLKVNGESLSGLQQSQVVDRLKAVKGGERIEIEISRVGHYTDDQQENTPPGEATSVKVERDDGNESTQKEQPDKSVAKSPKSRPPPPPPAQKQEDQEKDSDSEKVESRSSPQLPYSKPPENTSGSHKAIMVQTHDGPPTEELDLLVPLNDTGSAGLGVSLKARVSVKSDGTRHDCGIFVKKVLVGGAAWKDGRLHVDDQLITIEGIDLRQFVRNAEASEAVTAKLKEIGPSAKVVRLRVARQIPSHSSHVSNSSRITVDGPDSSIMLGGGGSAMSTVTTPLSRASRPSPGASSNRHSVDSSLLFALDHERRASNASVSTRKSDQGEEDLSPDPDAFDREAPARKSMSEKRGMGAAIDPSSMLTYQKIKHQRQTSAPSATVSRSFHGRSASQRAQARARSLSVHPRDPPRDSRRSDDVTSDSGHAPSEDSPQHRLSSAEASPKRRSKSVDTKRDSSGSLVHEAVAVDSGRTGFSHPSFKHAVGDGETRLGSGAAEVGGGLMRSDAAQHRDSDKRNRRKSMGSQVKSWLGLGSRSRDASPDRGFEEAKRKEESERMRIQESYDRLRAKEASKYGTPPMNLRRDRARVYSEYDPSYLQKCGVDANGYGGSGGGVAQSSTFDDFGLLDRYEQHRWAGQGPPPGPHHAQPYPHHRGGGAGHAHPPSYYAVTSSQSYHAGMGAPWAGNRGSAAYIPGAAPTAHFISRPHPPPPPRPAPSYYDAFNAWFAYSGGGAVGARPAVKAAFVGRDSSPSQSHSGRYAEGQIHSADARTYANWPRPLNNGHAHNQQSAISAYTTPPRTTAEPANLYSPVSPPYAVIEGGHHDHTSATNQHFDSHHHAHQNHIDRRSPSAPGPAHHYNKYSRKQPGPPAAATTKPPSPHSYFSHF